MSFGESEQGLSAEEVELRLEVAAIEAERPHEHLPPGQWVRKNLFNSVLNSIITVVIGVVGLVLVYEAVRYLIDADYTIIRDTLRIFMIGQFPNDELWRLWVAGFVLAVALGFAAGALARNAADRAIEQGLEPSISSLVEILRRFWAIIAVLLLFAAFTRTLPPKVGTVGVIATVFVARQIGLVLPAAIRRRAVFVTALLVIAAMLVIAGTSGLGGFAVGLCVAAWISSEMGRRDTATSVAGKAMRWIVPIVGAVVAGVIVWKIPFDGYGWDDWGGLMVNVFTAVIGVTLGLPFGILLALGRRSRLPVIKTGSVVYIEFVRGVPLISLLLFSGLLLPFFLPIDFSRPADLTLAIVVIGGFSAAYIAEIVRGGLQAVPKGQTEAAQALGLSPAAQQRMIVLPQALRSVIPAMVGQFIALFKDTTLLTVIGILEFLGAATVAANQPQFLGQRELPALALLFVAVGFWAFCYTMSKESRRLERRLGVGTR